MRHRFGAHFTPECGTTFRLWAPRRRRVHIELRSPTGERRTQALGHEDDDFFGLLAPDVGPGWRYRYHVDGEGPYPDPASRYQPEDVHGPSEVVSPAFAWTDADWRGPDWSRAIVYELHVGTFTRDGTFAGVASKLDHLVALGVSAIELMPVADFPGARNWGYDGCYLFAPDSSYGRPEDLKVLIDACHARGIGVILDVVYNHFGPDGNYLWPISRPFFNPRLKTPWGDGVDIAHPVVRAFYEANARFWVEEYHVDGLRFDAVDSLDAADRSAFLLGVQRAARAAAPQHDLFLVLENVDNQVELLDDGSEGAFDAQWNDDLHAALHVLLTGENGGHFGDFVPPEPHLERALRMGFAYQGEYSSWHRRPIGSPCGGMPLNRVVNFLQTHDMCGNRALGERLHHLIDPQLHRAAVGLLLFLPGMPLLFMGEEFGATTPFLFFCDHHPELGQRVREGRSGRHETRTDWLTARQRGPLPDPQDDETFRRCRLRWEEADIDGSPLTLYRQLIDLRRQHLADLSAAQEALRVTRDGHMFTLVRVDDRGREAAACVANLGSDARPMPMTVSHGQWTVLASTSTTELTPSATVPGCTCLWLGNTVS